MSFTITSSQLTQFAPHIDAASIDPLVSAINATTARFSIDQQQRRVRYFMAQTSFETQGYTQWSENLTYTTPDRLVTVWPSRFTMDQSDKSKAYAPTYTNNPQGLANLVYAGQYGNGNAASGDGWNFRGRGGFDLTFRSNYTQYSSDTYGDTSVVDDPDLVLQPQDAMLSAGWFWNTKGLSALADTDSFTAVTQKINGSTETVPQRLPVLNQANSIFQW
jgi:putative chitinase